MSEGTVTGMPEDIIADLRKHIDIYGEEIEDLKAHCDRLAKERQGVVDENADLKEQLAERDREIENLKKCWRDEVESHHKGIDYMQKQIDQREKQLAERNVEIVGLNERLDTFDEMADDFKKDADKAEQRVKELKGVIREVVKFWLNSPDDEAEYQKEANRLSGLMVAAQREEE